MPIQASIHFKANLSNVVVKDVLAGCKHEVGNVVKGDIHPFSLDDRGGIATVQVSGENSNSKPVSDGARLEDGEIYDFPQK